MKNLKLEEGREKEGQRDRSYLGSRSVLELFRKTNFKLSILFRKQTDLTDNKLT